MNDDIGYHERLEDETLKEIFISTTNWRLYKLFCYLFFRYRLRINVSANEQHIGITTFDSGQYFFGCDVKEYIGSMGKKVGTSIS